MWVRELVYKWIRDRHGSAELHIVQQRLCMRDMLPDQMLPIKRVLPKRGVHHRDSHQPLPSELGRALGRRRVVQPPARALRHVEAGVHEDSRMEGGDSPGAVPARAVPDERRAAIRLPRERVLAVGVRDERGRRRGHREHVGEREPNRVDRDEP